MGPLSLQESRPRLSEDRADDDGVYGKYPTILCYS